MWIWLTADRQHWPYIAECCGNDKPRRAALMCMQPFLPRLRPAEEWNCFLSNLHSSAFSLFKFRLTPELKQIRIIRIHSTKTMVTRFCHTTKKFYLSSFTILFSFYRAIWVNATIMKSKTHAVDAVKIFYSWQVWCKGISIVMLCIRSNIERSNAL